MKRHLRCLLHLLLVASLIVAGLPAHALVDAASPATAAAFLDDADRDAPDDGGCPFHAESASGPDADPVPAPSESSADDCCGPDCRCACAGLTLVLLPSTIPFATSPPTRHLSRSALNLPSTPSRAPLRPPQA
ncbi:MAG: hypothetical protein GVY11_00625 [Gammaproteobacteria bacterium]|jgi:hypothetical protein|nr:hypothetical protein [Gammaproteobacteria bacterium]